MSRDSSNHFANSLIAIVSLRAGKQTPGLGLLPCCIEDLPQYRER